MRVSIVGTGYVGLVSGVCLASKGHDVTCVDVDEAKVRQIQNGEPPIHEEGLEQLLKDNVGHRLKATTDLQRAVLDSDLTLIAVGTPFDGQVIDLGYVREASRQIGEALRLKPGFHSIIVKSTVVPGTTDDVVAPAVAEASGKKVGEGFGVGMNPEFLAEGRAVEDFMKPDRIVLGAGDPRTLELLEELYGVFPDADKVRTTPRTAEMIKYAANSLLATMISFANEIAAVCSAHTDVDVVEVLNGVHLDKRLSPILEDGRRVSAPVTTYIEAGCGFGGSCFPKDVKALVAHGTGSGVNMQLLESVLAINADQPELMVDLLRERVPDLEGVEVAVLGLAFKPGTDDIRESPALSIVDSLLRAGASLRLYDPIVGAGDFPVPDGASARHVDSLAEALQGVQAALLVTRWPEFEAVPGLIAALDEPPLLVDGRRMLAPESVPHYAGIGLRRAHA
ncbi:MAG: UDP-glucose/GDP-mannose dehydrogenase family protein [Gemmatimonadota bacterium]